MPRRHCLTRPVRLALVYSTAALLAGVTACSSGSPGTTSSSTDDTPGSTTSTSTSTTSSSTSTTPADPAAACADSLAGNLSRDQRVGQLLMVALTPTDGAAGLDSQIRDDHLGGILYLGGWKGSTTVSEASAHVQDRATASATGGVGLFVAADQEGGQVQQLTGSGYSTMPSALDQGTLSTSDLTKAATVWGRELSGSGVNVNLAPVADTVPSSIGTANGPIGRYGREFAHDPGPVAKSVAAFTKGMEAADVTATVKHFPGIGRISGNTDSSSTGITDTVTGPDDPYLRPFRAGIGAGAGMVMMSSATYTKLDPSQPAVFSHKVVTGLLRTRLGWDGVVITDDIGAAKAVSGVPVGERATRFIAAGGDIVLTVDPATTTALRQAVTTRMRSDSDFATKVDAAVRRVLELKVRMGLAGCSG